MSKRLEGKNAIITGSSRGIGKAVAERLAKEGANVCIIASRDVSKAEAVAEEFSSLGVKTLARAVNVADFAAVEALFAEVKKEWGSVDILVNNAGIEKDNLILKMSPEDFDAVINVNLKGVFNGVKAAFPIMMRQKSGKIVNMASVIGIMGNFGQANYAASKAGVIGLTKSAAKELASRGVTVNAVAPGYIKTDMTDALSDEIKEGIKQMIPMKRIGMPEDISSVVAFLCSSDADYITGQTLVVDGGMVMQ